MFEDLMLTVTQSNEDGFVWDC